MLDEPLGALDAIVRAELRYELRKLASDLGLTVIHVTHDQEEALSIADRVVIMKTGRIVEVGKPSEIYRSPKTLFTANFVGEANLLDGEILMVDDTLCTVEVAGHEVKVSSLKRRIGQRVIAFIRPEFVLLTPPTENGWPGRVKQVTFLGRFNRYVIETDGIEIISEVSTADYSTGFGVGERVSLFLNEANMALFDYPEEGLEKEVGLE
jgi:ABC-type Fe3+/spermidine/putrescine transport system ATPase subunit